MPASLPVHLNNLKDRMPRPLKERIAKGIATGAAKGYVFQKVWQMAGALLLAEKSNGPHPEDPDECRTRDTLSVPPELRRADGAGTAMYHGD